MLVQWFPRANARYTRLPVLGSYLDGFLAWLCEQGHAALPIRRRIQAAKRLDSLLRRRGVSDVRRLTASDLLAYVPARTRKNINLAAVVRSFAAYFTQSGMLAVPQPTSTQSLIGVYRTHLEKARGLAQSTVQHHLDTSVEFLDFVRYDDKPDHLDKIKVHELEGFMRLLATRRSRASLQHVAAHLRAFLRFLAGRGRVSMNLSNQVDTPRIYRGERLPRAMPWETVLALLNTIDRATAMGRRDYAIFLLIATYGLRASEIVSLSIDDIDWRSQKIRVPRSKVGRLIVLPLTEEVGAALVDYLQHGRPDLPHREVFLRARSPDGILKPTAVTEAFQHWVRHGQLPVSFQGPHCLRHSVAMHLLREGSTLKTIGDLLGHRSAEATCVYLRLHTDDLRDVALDLPVSAQRGGRP